MTTPWTDEDHDLRKYEAAVARGVPRQLARARYRITPDAFDQLERAFIFHWRDAWGAFRYGLRCLVTLRCVACRRRHLRVIREDARGRPVAKGWLGGGMTCVYGYGGTVRSAVTSWWWAGKHGDD